MRRLGIVLLAGVAAVLPAAPAEAAIACYDQRARTLSVDASLHVFRIGARHFACDRKSARVFALRLAGGGTIRRVYSLERRLLAVGEAGAALYDARTRRVIVSFSDPGASLGAAALAADEAAVATGSSVVRLRPGQDPEVLPAQAPRDLAYAAGRLWWTDAAGAPRFALRAGAPPAPAAAPAPRVRAVAAATRCRAGAGTLLASGDAYVFRSGDRIRWCRRGRTRILYESPEESRTAADVDQLAGRFVLARLDTETEQNSELSVDVTDLATGRFANVDDATGPAAAAGIADETHGDYRLLRNGAVLRSLRPDPENGRTRTSLTLLKGRSSNPTQVLTTTAFTDEATSGTVVYWADDVGPHRLDTTG